MEGRRKGQGFLGQTNVGGWWSLNDAHENEIQKRDSKSRSFAKSGGGVPFHKNAYILASFATHFQLHF